MKKIIIIISLLFLTGCISCPACPKPGIYFCPDGQCKEAVMQELEKAEDSIYFMLYSFTDNDIGNLVLTKHGEGINIQGIVEYQQSTSKYAQYSKLKKEGIPVIVDKNKALMHHKVWIIDEKTVITGSYNPTQNGNENNNENAVIIHDRQVAQQFINEFQKLYKLWENP